jgi:hypothetical protein
MFTFYRPIREAEFKMLSRAVQAWYRHYGASVNDTRTQVLCSAAIDLYNDGHRTIEEIASRLIDTYNGPDTTRINAATSIAIH